MSSIEGSNGAISAAGPRSARSAPAAAGVAVVGATPFDIPKELAERIAQAKSTVEAVAKNGRNNDQHYNFVKAEDVVETARKALNDAKVVVLPPTLVKEEFSDLSSRAGSSGMFVKAWFDFRVVDGETGEGYSTTKLGTATDYPGDKAIFKAETGATKYFLSALLSIPMGDGSDPEATEHGSDGAKVERKATRPASDRQKQLFRDLISKANLPRPANQAIVTYVGGKNPKKGAISDVIDSLMDGKGLEFARNHGWDKAAEEHTARAPAKAEGEASTKIDAKDADALLKLCREKRCSSGQVAAFLTAVGVAVGKGDARTKESVKAALAEMSEDQAKRFETMVVNAAQAREAAGAADELAPAAEQAPTGASPVEGAPEEIDPESPHAKALKTVEELGYAHEFENVSRLYYDSSLTELEPSAINELVALLGRARSAGISAASLGACVRRGNGSGEEVTSRNRKFTDWIQGTEDMNAQAAKARVASDAAEASQE